MSQPVHLDEVLGKIHHGDCIAGMNKLPAGSIDLAFADPPFNIGYDYDVYHDSKEYDHYLAWSRDWIGAVHRVLKPDGTFWLAIGDEYAAELKLESQKLGFHIRSWVIWYYTFGVNCKTKFSRSHVHLFHFVKDPKRFTFRASELENRIPSARLLVYGDSRGNPEGRLPDDTWILRPQDLADRFTPDEDTWYFPRVAGTFKERAGFHGCQMPEQLLGRIIRICSHEDGIVLDPFSGSATTLAVAKKLGRRFIGFDLSPDYVRRGIDRLMEISSGDPLDGAPEPMMSVPVTPSRQRKHTRKKHETPLDLILKASAKKQQRNIELTFERGLIDAFSRVRDGFSVDRVVADPDLNLRLIDECIRTGIAGDARAWNWQLFQLRKSGKLAHLPTTRRTEIPWERCDLFLYASEIAWREMLGPDCTSLDEILCDPDIAVEFDAIARQWAPDFTPLEYRWGALKLRKIAKDARSHARALKCGRLTSPSPIPVDDLTRIPNDSGVYLVLNLHKEEPLFAGETLNLRARLENQFRDDIKPAWDKWGHRLAVRFFKTSSATPLLIAYKSLCVQRFEPRYNLPDPALT